MRAEASAREQEEGSGRCRGLKTCEGDRETKRGGWRGMRFNRAEREGCRLKASPKEIRRKGRNRVQVNRTVV